MVMAAQHDIGLHARRGAPGQAGARHLENDVRLRGGAVRQHVAQAHAARARRQRAHPVASVVAPPGHVKADVPLRGGRCRPDVHEAALCTPPLVVQAVP
jgi:hypothetical protein